MDMIRSVLSKLVGLDVSVPSSSRVMPSEVRPLDAGQKKMFDAMLPVVVSTKALDFGRQSDDSHTPPVTHLLDTIYSSWGRTSLTYYHHNQSE
jgi:hypothetical protein